MRRAFPIFGAMQTHIFGALLLLLGAVAAAAQPAGEAPDTTRPATRRDSIVLRPVVVTATRASEPLTRVPYAVSAVDGGGLSTGISLEEALGRVPGLQLDNRFNFSVGDRLSVRGMGARSQFGVRGVKVVVDGIPATFADGQSALDAVDPRFIEHAEIIRGAASMLYGNAAGGAILLGTEGEHGSRVGASLAGQGGPVTAYARAEYPLGDGRLRYLGSQLVYDGWRQHSAASVSRHLLGAELVLGDHDSLRLRMAYATLDADNPGSLRRATADTAPHAAHPANVIQETGKDLRQFELGASWRHGFGGASLDAGAWGIIRTVDNPIIGRVIDLDRTALGARVAATGAAGAAITWTAGLDIDAMIDDRRNFSPASDGSALLLDQEETVTSYGPFAIVTAALLPQLAVSGALRYDAVRFAVVDRLLDSLPDDSGERTMSALSPSLGIAWSPSTASTVFANIATGFETPTTTELANRPSGAGGFNPDLEPQRSLSFELGARVRGAGETTIEVVGYHMLVDDELIPFELDDAPGRSYFRNAGSATHQGVELTFGSRPIEQLDVQVSVTYVDARFRDFASGVASFDGNRIPGVSPLLVAGSLGYRITGLLVGLDVQHQGATPVDDANTDESDRFTLIGARLSYEGLTFELAGSTMTLVPWIGLENALDARYVSSVVPNAAGGRFFEPGRGRVVVGGIELRLDKR